jgi:DNA-binding response OmpR family regulator
MKVLLIDERSDTLEFFNGSIVNLGYKTGIAKNKSDIFSMLSKDQYDIILTNGASKELNIDKDVRSKYKSVFVIYLSASENKKAHKHSGADVYLRRPFVASELRQAIKRPFAHCLQHQSDHNGSLLNLRLACARVGH